jgi:S-adenosylmethionine decarboxylase proenzyme
LEYYDCDEQALNDLEGIEALLVKAAKQANASVVRSTFHRFAPQGVSGVIVIEESHLSIHTWPEHGYAAVDFYTCGECSPDAAHPVIKEGLKAGQFEMLVINRGIWPPRQSLKLVSHISEGLEPALRAVGGGV